MFGCGTADQLKGNFDRAGVYRLLNELNNHYVRIDGSNPTVFLSKTQHSAHEKVYEVTATFDHLLVIMVEDMVIVYQRTDTENHYLANLACFAL